MKKFIKNPNDHALEDLKIKSGGAMFSAELLARLVAGGAKVLAGQHLDGVAREGREERQEDLPAPGETPLLR